MNLRLVICAVVVCAATVNAKCPNDCAGHGVCDASSQCECYNNYYGADCSLRVCTFGRAFVDSPIGDLNGDGVFSPSRHFDPRTNSQVDRVEWVSGGVSELGLGQYGYARSSRVEEWDEAHFYRECSNKGVCDRETGICECFPGYSGAGCARSGCSNECSGHGVCLMIGEIEDDYSAWDFKSTGQCDCDAGYTGPDCSLRQCPRGADPVKYNHYVTDSVQGIYWRIIAGDHEYTTSSSSKHSFLSDKPKTVYYTVTFTDEYGDEWTSHLLSIDYTSFCTSDGYCVSSPDFGDYSTNDMGTILETHAESLNSSLIGIPGSPMGGTYVHATGAPLAVSCDGGSSFEREDTLFESVSECSSGDNIRIVQDPDESFAVYPSAAMEGETTFIDHPDFRLDAEVTAACDFSRFGDAGNYISLDGHDHSAFGACIFVKMFAPGVQNALKVDYFYNPEGLIDSGDVVSYDEVSGTTNGLFTSDVSSSSDLVVVANVQSLRVWNEDDGDAADDFITESIDSLDYCSRRGICDFDTGICECFSGYDGLRCDDRNAIAYSY